MTDITFGVIFAFIFVLLVHIIQLGEEKRELLKFVIRLSTGQDLDAKESETPLSDDTKSAIRKHVDNSAEGGPFGGYPTFSALLQEMEAQSFKQDADNVLGDEIEPNANLINAHEETTEENHQHRLNLRKKMQQAAAKVVEEYQANTRPVEIGDRR
jgi:hypothetical protein